MATSRRGYLTIAELQQLADITVIDSVEGYDQISQAEEIIDDYVGPTKKFIDFVSEGLLASVQSSTNITLENYHQNVFQADYFVGCWIEIVGGGGAGGRDKITASTYSGVLTLESGIAGMDSTSYYRIWQLGRFPRVVDCTIDSRHTPIKYYRQIPEKVRRAVAYQVEYMINMGPSFFGSDKVNMDSERIGDYQYKKAPNTGGTVQLIAPKAILILRGLINRTGGIID